MEATTNKRAGPDGECCVERSSTQSVLEEIRMKERAIYMLGRADSDLGTPLLRLEHSKGVVNSAEFNISVTIRTLVRMWDLRSFHCKLGNADRGE